MMGERPSLPLLLIGQTAQCDHSTGLCTSLWCLGWCFSPITQSQARSQDHSVLYHAPSEHISYLTNIWQVTDKACFSLQRWRWMLQPVATSPITSPAVISNPPTTPLSHDCGVGTATRCMMKCRETGAIVQHHQMKWGSCSHHPPLPPSNGRPSGPWEPVPRHAAACPV
jgi:hypothetical protein